MPLIFLCGFVAIGLWSIVAHRFERIGIAGPAALAVAGAVLVLIDVNGFAAAVASDEAEHVVEFILAVLLFVDACEVSGGVFGGEGRIIARLVFVALPLALLAVVVGGVFLLPGLNLFVLIVIACVVMPTDFSTAATLLRSPRIPARVRQILNVESGYNDGLISPIFGMALAAAVAWPTIVAAAEADSITPEAETQIEQRLEEFGAAMEGALPSAVVAIVIGAVVGALFGFLVRWADRRGWTNASGIRYVMLLVPLIAFGIATFSAIEANGFLAAFTAGILYRLARTRRTDHHEIPHDEVLLVEEAGTLAADIVWFVLGAMATVVALDGFDLRLLLVALLALTLFRAVPVYVSLLGSSLSRSARTLVGFVGPRGAATIVFGLLAYNQLPDVEGADVLAIMVFTVIGSILLHGVLLPWFVERRLPLPAAVDRPA